MAKAFLKRVRVTEEQILNDPICIKCYYNGGCKGIDCTGFYFKQVHLHPTTTICNSDCYFWKTPKNLKFCLDVECNGYNLEEIKEL